MEENVIQSAKHEVAPTVNRSRYEAHCSICASPCRREIEEAFVNWQHSACIGKDYDTTREAIYATHRLATRLANAAGMSSPRWRR